MRLLDHMKSILSSWIFASIGMEKEGKGAILLFEIVIAWVGAEHEDIVGVIEFLIEKAIDLNIGFGRFGAYSFVLQLVDFLGVLV